MFERLTRLRAAPRRAHSPRSKPPNSPRPKTAAGVYVQAGEVHAAGDLLPGPTGRVSSATPTAANGGAAAQSGLGEMPVISTGDMAAASVYGAGGAAVAVAAPSAFYVGGGTRATATADATGLYGGSKAISNSWEGGELPGQHRHRDEFGDVMATRVGAGARVGVQGSVWCS